MTTLTGAERLLRAARREAVDHPPVWLMRQAGRYLPEYQAVRRQHDFVACCTTPALSQELSLQPWRRFGVDGVIVFTDILMPLTALGLDFRVDEGIGPQLAPVMERPADVARLRTPTPHTDFAYLAETLQRLRTDVGTSAAVIGFCGAPWTVATYMVRGSKAVDIASVAPALAADTALFAALCDRLVPLLADYLTLQAKAGAQLLQIFDSWATALSPAEYQAIAAPPLRALIARVKQQTGGTVPITIYAQGSDALLETFVECGADVVSIDGHLPLAAAHARVGHRVALQGNLAPEVLLSDAKLVRAATRAMLDTAPRTGYIANLGHGVLKDTSIASVQAFVETVQHVSDDH